MRNVRDGEDCTALSKLALEFEHDIDWDNYEILNIETDFKRRKFIESFFINSENDALNDRDSVSFPQMYRNLQQNYAMFVFFDRFK